MPDDRDLFRDRLRARLTELGKSPYGVSREMGANTGYVRDLLDPKKSANPSADKLAALASILETTTDYLTGMADNPGQPRSEILVQDRRLPWRDEGQAGPGIPVMGSAFCDDLAVEGTDGEHYQVERVLLEQDHSVQMIRRPEALRHALKAYAFYYYGASMEPRYFQGEMGIADPTRPARPGDFVVVPLTDGQSADIMTVLVKQLVRETSAYVELRQFNPPMVFRIPRQQIAGKLHRIIPSNEIYGA